jgi:hypothetical protein
MPHQEREQIELARGERQLLAAQRRFVRGDVDDESTVAQRTGIGRRVEAAGAGLAHHAAGAPQHGAHP